MHYATCIFHNFLVYSSRFLLIEETIQKYNEPPLLTKLIFDLQNPNIYMFNAKYNMYMDLC